MSAHSTPITVALVDDEEPIRQQLARTVAEAGGLACVGAFADGEHALRALPKAAPDVVLMDIKMPRLSGIECVRQLKDQCPHTAVIMLTLFDDHDLIFDSLKAGAVGYLLKSATSDQIVQAIREVHAGGSPMTPEIARKVASHFHEKPSAHAGTPHLTAREQEILRLAREGLAAKDIAAALDIALATVNNHFRHIFDKLHVSTRTAAIHKYFHT